MKLIENQDWFDESVFAEEEFPDELLDDLHGGMGNGPGYSDEPYTGGLIDFSPSSYNTGHEDQSTHAADGLIRHLLSEEDYSEHLFFAMSHNREEVLEMMADVLMRAMTEAGAFSTAGFSTVGDLIDSWYDHVNEAI